MSDFCINARGLNKQASAALAGQVAGRLREKAVLSLEAYNKRDTDPGIASLHAAANYVSTLDRSHPNLFAIFTGQTTKGYEPTAGEEQVMSLVAGNLTPVAPDVVIAEMGCAALEDRIVAERSRCIEAQAATDRVRQELEQVRSTAERVPGLIDEAAALRNRIAEVESELAAQQKRTEFVAARWAAEQSADKPKILKKTTVAA